MDSKVDKTTQEQKDAEQDNKVTALETKWANAILDSATPNGATGNEIATASFVRANTGGKIPTEAYGDILGDEFINGKIVLDSAVNASTSSTSLTWDIATLAFSTTTDKLYYDIGNNVLKRATYIKLNKTESGTITTSRRYSPSPSSTEFETFKTAINNWLLGKVTLSYTAVRLMIDSEYIFECGWNNSTGVITSGSSAFIWVCPIGSLTRVSLSAGEHSVTWMNRSSSTDSLPNATTTSIPSTYKQVADLLA